MLKVNELFSGIGAFRKALQRLNIPHEIIGISEIDKFAIKSYEAIYGKTRNYGDISKIDKLDYADLWTYGFPCQDISLAGQQAGIVKGKTRSGLLYEVQRLLVIAAEHCELPKYLILENVKNLVSKKFIGDFISWIEWLSELGYDTYWQVINAKDCGIPQNRERVFAVSIRKGLNQSFSFPCAIPLQWSMFDLLEDDVEEKYYLSEDTIERYLISTSKNANRGNGFAFDPRERGDSQNDNNKSRIEDDRQFHHRDRCLQVGRLIGGKWEKMIERPRRVYSPKGLCPTLHTQQGGNNNIKILVAQATEKGYAECVAGGVADLSYPKSKTRRGRVQENGLICPTITAKSNNLYRLESFERIRKLTPLECWRLMGFNDEDFRKAEKVCSDTQLYKQAGNSIVVDVLEGILGALIPSPQPKELESDNGGKSMTYIFDCEVFKYDWLFVFKSVESGVYAIFHNDNEAIKEFVNEGNLLLGGFNNKHYDQFILKAILNDALPEEIKELNDYIILGSGNGWEHPLTRDCRQYFEQFDLMDDCQAGLSLKAIEAHLGMDIRESEVDFNIDRPLTEEELRQTIFYCKHDVDATEKLYHLRKGYLENKLFLGKSKGLSEGQALYMTNAKLTAMYLDAEPKKHNDERDYQYPENLLRDYIPGKVFRFFNRLYDSDLTDEEVFSGKLNFNIGDCQCTIGYGGIHGAIPTYREKSTATRSIRNRDVASYYPHLMTLDGYCSRSIPNPKVYAAMLERRMRAKKAGDKATANALKLVANTTYGAMLNQYNDLNDPLMGRSVCITGQLRLLELTNHLVEECPTLKVVQLNTDGIMVSLDNSDLNTYNEICQEWQDRTGFELEEDCIAEIVQKDVNNYVEIAIDGSTKIKGGQLVRGIAQAGAFNINNNATVVADAILKHFIGIPVEETIEKCNDILAFQLVAKASSKYSAVYHWVDGEPIRVQKCNRVYAVKDTRYGTLIKTHAEKGNNVKIGGLPEHCIVDNSNELTIDTIDKGWYIRLARKYVKDFLGIKPPKKNTRKINSLAKKALRLLEEV